MKKKALTLLLLVFCLGNIFAQQTSYYFKHYNNNSGLSQNTVMSIFQDSKGFIWMGTKNGLNRFDGHEFKIYQRGESLHELKNSMIFSICEDRNNTLWIGTDQGISLYNPFTEKFSSFNRKTEKQEEIEGYVNKIFIDKKDRVWVLAGNGLFLFNPTENKFYSLNKKFAPYSPTFPRALFVDNEGIAYIGLPDT
ncbi:MAG: two-component regulator propeller domain-containing protein, partial [Angelakisella sp.]